MTPLRALIVDDEPLAREELRLLLEAAGGIEVLAECGNALEALPAVHRLKPDVLFLDIQMPRISGLELVGMLDPAQLPQIVFITAYDEYALRAFDEQALDTCSSRWIRRGCNARCSACSSRRRPAPCRTAC